MAVFSAAELGGSELFNLEFLRRAHERGCAIAALVPDDGPLCDALAPICDRIQVVAIPQQITRLSRFDKTLGKSAARAVVSLPGYERRLHRALQQTPGALCCLGFRSQLACAATSLLSRRRHCWVVHEVVPPSPAGRLWGTAARGADIVMTYSQTAAQQRTLRRANARVYDVRFDLRRFAAVPSPRQTPRTLGLVGDLFALKNHLGAIRTTQRLRANGEPVECLLIGRPTADHVYTADVHDALAACGAGARLEAVRPDEMPQALTQIDVLLHLSTVPESFGRVCVEAMAAGRPVVAFDHGGVGELVEHEVSGLLCPPGDLESVAAAIVRLRHEPGLFARLSRNARDRAQQRWSSDHAGTTIGDALADFARATTAR